MKATDHDNDQNIYV